MVRRLSITVPDELWDSLTHLDQSPSALVQRALRCLHDTEGPGAGPTPIEAAAADIPYWESVLDSLTEQATELRAEGYEAAIMAMHEGVLSLHWLELIVQQYAADELPALMSEVGDIFLRLRHTWGDNGFFVERPVAVEEVETVLFGKEAAGRLGETWREDNRELLTGVCEAIALQEDGLLASNANGDHFRLDPEGVPTTDIPLTLWEGMTAAIVDTVSAVRRRVRAENNPATLGSYRQ